MGKAIVLAGGYATRLRPLTLTKPKSLLLILDKPLIDWIVELLVNGGVDNLIFSVYHMADVLINHLKSIFIQLPSSVKIDFIYEEEPLGDAGPLHLVNSKIGLTSTFIVSYGDVFSFINVGDMVKYHREHGGIATIMLTRVEDVSRYGVAVVNSNNKVLSFIEKPKPHEVKSNLVNAGMYVFEPEVLNYIPKGRSKLSADVIPKLVEKFDVYGYLYDGFWSDIGVPADYKQTNINVLRIINPQGYLSQTAKIGEDVELVPPYYIGERVIVGRGSRIGPNVVVGCNTRIGERVRIFNTITLPKSRVRSGSYIENSIIGEECYIGRWSRISENVIIGDGVSVDDEIYIAPNVVILPYKEIKEDILENGKIIL
jgi:mannose-1-phosphate guanylyltransferase